MLIFVKKDTPEAAIRSLVIQLSRQGIGTARADSAGRTMLTLVGETWTLDEQRLLAVCNELQGEPIFDLVKGTVASIKAFAGAAPQSDDITLMAIEYRGRPSVS